jgi:ATP synthase protein I
VRGNAVTAAFGFLVWELAKIGLAVAMLAAAAKWVTPLSWPALLAAMAVCMKASWLALLAQRAPAIRRTNATRV